MKRSRPTISDVAREADVSVGTVSNYLNGTANVRKATKLRIDAAIRRLAYRPSTFARALSSSSVVDKELDRSSMPRLIVVGYTSVDYMCRVDVLPHRDDRVTAHHIEKALGGPAANLAVATAGVGANGSFGVDVELATALGDDPDSEWAIVELAAKGVHAVAIRAPANKRLSRCIVFIEPNGSRTIVNEPFELSEMDLTDHFDLSRSDRKSCLHIEGYHLDGMRGSIGRLKEAGWLVTLHSAGLPETVRSPSCFLQLLEEFDVVFAGDALIREILDIRLSGNDLVNAVDIQLARLERRGALVLTLGAMGAVVFPPTAESPVSLAALPVLSVDATGAGDSFAGTFLAYYLNGATLADAAQYAAASASLTVTAEGAQGRTSSHEDLVEVLKEQKLLPTP
ncbi:PfkB family carbohydrate kinase [Labrenzia sp. 011]|uniref:carbohydrate kinase family protein n=1 Tax=Labrenzia sp. 011 TaxID=2171494 RepID=UPI000D508AC4|nr:PfkB family carbohydrate kinase [Labrenzia sp. 011]PVB59517.1 carbohydrate kinase [Labrenzia sp. 011]